MPIKLRLSTRGRLVLPREIRVRHGWAAGCLLEVEDRGDVVVVRKALSMTPPTNLDDLVGCVGYRGPTVSLEAMDVGSRPDASEA